MVWTNPRGPKIPTRYSHPEDAPPLVAARLSVGREGTELYRRMVPGHRRDPG